MEAIIQDKLNYEFVEGKNILSLQAGVTEINRQFIEILSNISDSQSENDLRLINSKLTKVNTKHFLIGFGGHHMWVKQIINGEAVQQIIFVKFD